LGLLPPDEYDFPTLLELPPEEYDLPTLLELPPVEYDLPKLLELLLLEEEERPVEELRVVGLARASPGRSTRTRNIARMFFMGDR
jgi:hypothetical protein